MMTKRYLRSARKARLMESRRGLFRTEDGSCLTIGVVRAYLSYKLG